MISRRPQVTLSTEDALLYDSIDGRKTVERLEELHGAVRHRLLEWYEASIIELIPPISTPAGPHLVVIEPHMDDAALSVGGRLLNRRGKCRITILSVVRWSNFTSYLTVGKDYVNVEEISELRRQESVLVAKCLGAEHRCLEWSDAPLRFWPTERWSSTTVERFRRAPQMFTNLLPAPKEVSSLAQQLREHLEALAPDELWIPMGLGNHIDHRTTRSACLLLLHEARGRLAGIPILMYEDLPYAATVGHAGQITRAMAGVGTRLVRGIEDVRDVFDEKLRVVSIYASQFKLRSIEPAIRGLADRAGRAKGILAEVCHQVEGTPCLPLESNLSRESAGLTSLQVNTRTLLRDRVKCRRLTVMALPSGHLGSWKADSQSLIKTFPNVDLRVYASEDLAWQAEECGSQIISLRFVKQGVRGWAGVTWREFFRFRNPTVVLWRGAYGSEPMLKRKKLVNLLIKALLPFRRVLLARTLWDFCTFLNQDAGTESNHVNLDKNTLDVKHLKRG